MKIRPDRLASSKLCQSCRKLFQDECPEIKWLRSKSLIIDDFLVGCTTIKIGFQNIIIDCPEYRRDVFLSDYFPFLDR